MEKHGYDVLWINPADGETVAARSSRATTSRATPPDRSHDWVLHVVREGTLQSMNSSYKFESRDIVLQEIEANPPKMPFEIEQPASDCLAFEAGAVRGQADARDARHAHP